MERAQAAAPVIFLQVKDRVSRAYGLLTNATLLSTQEALALLSFLRMGASLDIFSHQALKTSIKPS